MKIPNLYDTEHVALEDKIIYEKWEIPRVGFYWLIAEYDPKRELAFGYANLNDEEMAEWGYISIKELREVGAMKIEDYNPKTFLVCLEEIRNLKISEKLGEVIDRIKNENRRP